MLITDVPFTLTDWSRVPPTQHPGEAGTATWRTFEMGNVRARIVEYSAGYVADHWCNRGHVLYVLKGELLTELASGEQFTLTAGTSYQVAENAAPHRSRTSTGATLFIVD